MHHAVYILIAIQITSFCGAQRSVGDKCDGPDSKKGVCQLIKDCSGVQENIREGIRPRICGFQDKDPIICCLASKPQAVVTRVPGETAQKWCKEYQRSCPKPIDGWRKPLPPIAGGDPANSEEFPHMAAIGYGNEKDIAWSCGGTLISEKFVLTAAHCMSSRETGPANWVLLGTVRLINTTATDGRNGQIHPITRRIRHPDYKPPAKYHDIALFEIGPAVTPNPRPLNIKQLHPACLGTSRTFTGSKAIATGWGRTGHADDGSSSLLKVELDVFDASVCQEAYDVEIKSTTLLRNGIVSSMLCAGVLEGKRDTCQGDSGGPLQISIESGCSYMVLGVTSFGKVCAFPNSPSVYSKVFEYISWIEDTVWPE